MASPIDLRNLRIASPCSERWDSMTGDERKRFCARCQLHVYNVSELSSAEVTALLTQSEGRVCGRIFRRADGTVLTRDCPVGLRKVRMRIAAGLTAAMALVIGFISAVRSRNATDESEPAPELFSAMRLSAYELEERARELPYVGAVIEWIDPAPALKHTAGLMILPRKSYPTGSIGAEDLGLDDSDAAL